MGLIGDSEKVKKNIFKVKDGDDHFGFDIFYKNTMNLFNNHGQNNKRQFAFFYHTFESDIGS